MDTPCPVEKKFIGFRHHVNFIEYRVLEIPSAIFEMGKTTIFLQQEILIETIHAIRL